MTASPPRCAWAGTRAATWAPCKSLTSHRHTALHAQRTALFSPASQPPLPAARDGGSEDEVRIAGFVDCCVCCGRGAHVETTVSPSHVAFKLEERQCGECCVSCNALFEESVEMQALEAAKWVKGAPCSRRALCVASPCLLLGPLCPLGCLACLLLWGESAGTAIELTSAGDLRPSERGPASGQLQLPALRYAEFWEALRRALGAGKAAPGAFPLPPSRHFLSATSSLTIAESRVLELTQAPCCCACGGTTTLAHARNVQWARLPAEHCCTCCGVLQLGFGAPALASAPMGALGTAALLQRLRGALLLRPPAGALAGAPRPPPPATFSTTHPCACGRSTVSIDADFVTVEAPGQVLLVRTADVPFVYQERSGRQPVLGAATFLVLCGLLVAYALVGVLAFQRASIYGWDCTLNGNPCPGASYLSRSEIDGAPAAAWFLLSPLLFALVWWALSAAGLVSVYAAVSCCCCRFSKVAVGTPGAAESELGSSNGCCGSKSAQRKELYKWTDGGQEASAFVARARELIRFAKALDRECGGSAGSSLAAVAVSGAPKVLAS